MSVLPNAGGGRAGAGQERQRLPETVDEHVCGFDDPAELALQQLAARGCEAFEAPADLGVQRAADEARSAQPCRPRLPVALRVILPFRLVQKAAERGLEDVELQRELGAPEAMVLEESGQVGGWVAVSRVERVAHVVKALGQRRPRFGDGADMGSEEVRALGDRPPRKASSWSRKFLSVVLSRPSESLAPTVGGLAMASPVQSKDRAAYHERVGNSTPRPTGCGSLLSPPNQHRFHGAEPPRRALASLADQKAGHDLSGARARPPCDRGSHAEGLRPPISTGRENASQPETRSGLEGAETPR